jgi:hypothetical protein
MVACERGESMFDVIGSEGPHEHVAFVPAWIDPIRAPWGKAAAYAAIED